MATHSYICLGPKLAQGAGESGRRWYLDGGDEGCGEVGAKAGRQSQLANILVLTQGAGDGLLTQ